VASHHPIRKLIAPEPVAIPDKLYFRIGDVAQLCDVPAYVLRFWETEFPQLKPNKGGTGQRLYRKRDVEMAMRIKSLLYDQGYTIPGARQVFKSEAKAKESAESDTRTIDLGPQSPPDAHPADAHPAMDVGAASRQDAQHRDQLSTLRDELRSLAKLLAGAASAEPAQESTVGSTLAARNRPLRPRLVLEPRPELKAEAQSEPLRVDQGDLFPSE
jgi:DNA-binding transcriptional MerR regulator